MDGVLVDNMEAHVAAFVEFGARYGVAIDGNSLGWMYGKGNDEIIPRLLPSEVIEQRGLKALGDEKEAVYREIYKSSMQPVAGLLEFLEDLRRSGVKCAVSGTIKKMSDQQVHASDLSEAP